MSKYARSLEPLPPPTPRKKEGDLHARDVRGAIPKEWSEHSAGTVQVLVDEIVTLERKHVSVLSPGGLGGRALSTVVVFLFGAETEVVRR